MIRSSINVPSFSKSLSSQYTEKTILTLQYQKSVTFFAPLLIIPRFASKGNHYFPTIPNHKNLLFSHTNGEGKPLTKTLNR